MVHGIQRKETAQPWKRNYTRPKAQLLLIFILRLSSKIFLENVPMFVVQLLLVIRKALMSKKGRDGYLGEARTVVFSPHVAEGIMSSIEQ